MLGWTLPQPAAEELNAEFGATFVGHGYADVDLIVPVDRERQRMASLAHASQAAPTSVLWRRLDLLGDVEYLRWLRREGSLATEVCGDDVGPTPTRVVSAVGSAELAGRGGHGPVPPGE